MQGNAVIPIGLEHDVFTVGLTFVSVLIDRHINLCAMAFIAFLTRPQLRLRYLYLKKCFFNIS